MKNVTEAIKRELENKHNVEAVVLSADTFDAIRLETRIRTITEVERLLNQCVELSQSLKGLRFCIRYKPIKLAEYIGD